MAEEEIGPRSGGAVIVDDGSPRRRVSRSEPQLNAKSKYDISDITDNGKKKHTLSLASADKVVVTYRGAFMEFPWTLVKSAEVYTAHDFFKADLTNPGEVTFSVKKKFTKKNSQYEADDIAAIRRIFLQLDGQGKLELTDPNDFEGNVEFFFTHATVRSAQVNGGGAVIIDDQGIVYPFRVQSNYDLAGVTTPYRREILTGVKPTAVVVYKDAGSERYAGLPLSFAVKTATEYVVGRVEADAIILRTSSVFTEKTARPWEYLLERSGPIEEIRVNGKPVAGGTSLEIEVAR